MPAIPLRLDRLAAHERGRQRDEEDQLEGGGEPARRGHRGHRHQSRKRSPSHADATNQPSGGEGTEGHHQERQGRQCPDVRRRNVTTAPHRAATTPITDAADHTYPSATVDTPSATSGNSTVA